MERTDRWRRAWRTHPSLSPRGPTGISRIQSEAPSRSPAFRRTQGNVVKRSVAEHAAHDAYKALAAFKHPGEWLVHTSLHVDGRAYSVALDLDWAEHRRRQMLRISSLTSTGLLHALWEIPYGFEIARETLSTLDCETLDRAASGWVDRSAVGFVRRYQPAGIIRSIAITSESVSRAVQRAAAFPPTTKRVVVWMNPSGSSHCRITSTLERARRLGIGVLSANGDSLNELIAPGPVTRGLPNVFRWWQAELAYRNWLTRTAPTAGVGTSA